MIVSADGCQDAGFCPVNVAKDFDAHVDVMLLPKKSKFMFAEWERLGAEYPKILKLISSGVSPNAAKTRYEKAVTESPAALAALLNIAAAMDQILLTTGTALNFLCELKWDTLVQDRFFAYAKLTNSKSESNPTGSLSRGFRS